MTRKAHAVSPRQLFPAQKMREKTQKTKKGCGATREGSLGLVGAAAEEEGGRGAPWVRAEAPPRHTEVIFPA